MLLSRNASQLISSKTPSYADRCFGKVGRIIRIQNFVYAQAMIYPITRTSTDIDKNVNDIWNGRIS